MKDVSATWHVEVGRSYPMDTPSRLGNFVQE